VIDQIGIQRPYSSLFTFVSFVFEIMWLLNKQGSTGKSNVFLAMNPDGRGGILKQTLTFIILAHALLYIDVYASTVNLLL
jgi:hypothetical protein